MQQSPLPIGRPHLPLEQVPLQHCALVVQARPTALHAGPHFPPLQRPLQHCALVVHVRPSALHAGPHLPAVQVPLQQSVLAAQARPSALHIGVGMQTLRPGTQLLPLQQSAVVVQGVLAGAQPQAPLTQALPLQHCALFSHAFPKGRQVAHAPAMQNFCVSPQHWKALEQGEPTPAQQVPLGLQVLPLQHAVLPPPQDSPRDEQC